MAIKVLENNCSVPELICYFSVDEIDNRTNPASIWQIRQYIYNYSGCQTKIKKWRTMSRYFKWSEDLCYTI